MIRPRCVVVAALAFAPLANAEPPAVVVQSCLNFGSVSRTVGYRELNAAELSDSEDGAEMTLSYELDGESYGYVTAQRGNEDFFFAGEHRYPVRDAVVRSGEKMERLDATKSIFALIRYNHRPYLCAASTFDGLGRSGSFQNVRFGYVAVLTASRPRAIRRLYFGVSDIREHQAPPSVAPGSRQRSR